MDKRIKMVIYGEPGVGKSVFACGAPKPFFITTDGNYEWLEDFGAKEKDHIQVSTWTEIKKAIDKSYDGYETIVLDLTEDCFKWCEYEYCKANGLEHVSDSGYGKGYDITRNDFLVTMSKLIAKDKHIIFIMHGLDTVVKDKRGVEHTKHIPTDRLPGKVIDQLEGRVRYFLRCYVKDEEQNGKTVKKRYLSLIPKANEFGICRGLQEDKVPHDIPLKWSEFEYWVLGDSKTEKEVVESAVVTEKIEEIKETDEGQPRKRHRRKVTEEVQEEPQEESNEEIQEEVIKQTASDEVLQEEPLNNVEAKVEVKEEPKTEAKTSKEDALAAIKAKLAAIKAARQ